MDSSTTHDGGLTLNVVYEGAPEAGKTESLLALGRLLGRQVSTPAERNGRTLYFDWLSYQGGRRQGRPIRARAIAVPGQKELARRRRTLVERADVLVFVADSSSERFARSAEHFTTLLDELVALGLEDLPIVLQINKRDAPDALDSGVVLQALPVGRFRQQIETIATKGAGIREAFVFAVSEAIKHLSRQGRLYSQDDLGRGLTGIRLNPEQVLEMLLDQDRAEKAPASEGGGRSSLADILGAGSPQGLSSPAADANSNDDDSDGGDRAGWGTRPFDLPVTDDSRPR